MKQSHARSSRTSRIAAHVIVELMIGFPRTLFKFILGLYRKKRYDLKLGKKLSGLCLDADLPLSKAELSDGGVCLNFSGWKICLPESHLAGELIRAHRLLESLAAHKAISSYHDEESDRLVINVEGLAFPCANYEEICIVHEIIVEGAYEVFAPAGSVILDIGANIGFAAIRLAQINPEAKIYCYEPLPINIRRWSETLSMNNSLSDRIQLIPFGLGERDSERSLFTADGARGCSSLTERSFHQHAGKAEAEIVTVINVSKEFSERARESSTGRVVVKMDCEGAEFEIIAALHQAGMLETIGFLRAEWHAFAGDIHELTKVLKTSGFAVQLNRSVCGSSGMISAGRLNA